MVLSRSLVTKQNLQQPLYFQSLIFVPRLAKSRRAFEAGERAFHYVDRYDRSGALACVSLYPAFYLISDELDGDTLQASPSLGAPL